MAGRASHPAAERTDCRPSPRRGSLSPPRKGSLSPRKESPTEACPGPVRPRPRSLRPSPAHPKGRSRACPRLPAAAQAKGAARAAGAEGVGDCGPASGVRLPLGGSGGRSVHRAFVPARDSRPGQSTVPSRARAPCVGARDRCPERSYSRSGTQDWRPRAFVAAGPAPQARVPRTTAPDHHVPIPDQRPAYARRSPRWTVVPGRSSPDATFRPRPRPVGAARCAGIVADGRPLRRLPRIPGRDAFVRMYKCGCTSADVRV